MTLTDAQKRVLKQLADAYLLACETWTDELGNALADANLLPLRDLYESASELYASIAEGVFK